MDAEIDLNDLRQTAQQFITQTDSMLAAAEQGQWDVFRPIFDERQALLSVLMAKAGSKLLKHLPDLLDAYRAVLEKNRRIELLMKARRDELGEQLSFLQREKRLRRAYR